MSETEPKKLTPSDPISKETLGELSTLEQTQYDIGLQMLRLEEDKIALLAASRGVDQQRRRIFEKVLVERGLEPTANVEIDWKTGSLTLLDTKKPKKGKKS